MIVTCEKCKTKFRVNDNLVPPEGIKARCSKCNHVFMITPKQESDQDSDGPALSVLDEELEVGRHKTAKPVGTAPREKRTGISTLSKRLFWGTLIGFSLLCLFLLFSFMRSYKASHVKVEIDPGNKYITVSSETNEYFIDNLHLGQLFVVQGMVRNEYPQARSFIYLKATLYVDKNEPFQTLTLYCGNPLTKHELRTLTLQELQKTIRNKYGKSRANVNVLPNAEVPFTVFFYNLPELSRLTTYKIAVVSSEPYKPSN